MTTQSTQQATREPGQPRSADGDHIPSKSQEIIAVSGISPRLWRLYAYFWLICLLLPILSLVQAPVGGLRLLVAVSGLIVFAATYVWVMWPHPLAGQGPARFGLRPSVALLSGLTLLVLALSLVYGASFLWLFIGVSAIAGISLPFSRAAIAVVALTLLTLGLGVILSGNLALTTWILFIPLVLLVRGLGLDMIGFVRLAHALRELQEAREDLARQAVTEERLRMARDLHDLLGHTLSLIALKSELAGRLLENDRRGAAREIQEVEHVARQALREVREAVAGYRQPTLRGELDGARQILEAAGIGCAVEYDGQSLPSGMDTILAWVVREGVTNVIRHSCARHCLIRVLATSVYARAEVSNDGYPSDKNGPGQAGSGLAGLAERVAAQGGHIAAGPQVLEDQPGFRLSVEIPISGTSFSEAR